MLMVRHVQGNAGRAAKVAAVALARLLGVGLTSAIIGVLVAGLFAPLVVFIGYGSDAVSDGVRRLPQPLQVRSLAQRTTVLDRHGELLATFYDQNRVTVRLKEVAPVMRKAILAIEDWRFYEHNAIDVQGTVRALLRNSTDGAAVQGGSTITQQLVKMELVDQARNNRQVRLATEQSYARKLRELRYALAVESRRSKSWILQRYLNIAYFGDGAYGIEAAAQHYFSISADRLRLPQAAMLAGLVKNPTGYDPTNSRGSARQRRNVVLDRMADLRLISERRFRRERARGLGLRLEQRPNGCVSTVAPFFCQYVRDYLLTEEALGDTEEERAELLRAGGLTIRTTLDVRMQRAADASVRRHVYPTDQAVGAVAMVEPGTGAVRALAQSRPMGTDRSRGETFLNYTVPEEYGDAMGFQAGSTFKAFVLAAAVDQGIPLSTRIVAPQQISIPVARFRGCQGQLRSDDVWTPANSTGSGRFDLYGGTQQSVNTFFAQLELRTGLCRPYQLAQQMGIRLDDPDNQQVPSFTLGVVDTDPLSMAGAYATFAARGVHCPPRPVVSIEGAQGRLLKRYDDDCRRVLPAPVADAVNDVLRGVQEPGGFGYGAGLALGQPTAAKTGTTNTNRAVWFIGYTPDMATSAMLAGVDGQGRWKTLNGQQVGGVVIGSASGSGNAGKLWGDAMRPVQGLLPDRDFVRPDPILVRGVPVTVPDVRGLTFEEAQRRLEEIGFFVKARPSVRPSVRSPYASGTVARMRPRDGASAASGRTIALQLARRPRTQDSPRGR
ncbi:MAG: Multimodular transpeptidase-transglycosylase [uncultured Nocardioidaceae bacterium]|uniref:Multimodular transpeptidase-transglycosylase n=1 Tax=uncultured Nocardioidaceae bacterium TaxID=253824 RepID=A0A6J4NLV8_9ACTN|nr:MAG: Multimodular transpeptidase-transglycosylase [uncultured Nocardioidaceae bacterium]